MKFIKIITIILIFLTISTFLTSAQETNNIKIQNISTQNNNAPYQGILRIYIVEPTSRWQNDFRNKPYNFGFLEFAYNDDISINYNEEYTKNIEYNPTFSGIKENKIMVIAALFDPRDEKKISYPQDQDEEWFESHTVDAVAAAKPGETGYNTATNEFTHTIFAEVGTRSTSYKCSMTEKHLESIYFSDDYPFYYVNMVVNKNNNGDTEERMYDRYEGYKHQISPSTYFDGGYEIINDGIDDESIYRDKIETSGLKDVHDFDLSVSVEWMGFGKLNIEINIKNNEQINYPLKPNILSGPHKGEPNKLYQYNFSTLDPNDDGLYYKWEGLTQEPNWNGVFQSGEKISENHSWSKEGTYKFRVKAKDIDGNEGPWSDFYTVKIESGSVTHNMQFSYMKVFLERLSVFFPFLNRFL